MTVRSGRGGWSPAVFAGILDAGFDLLTYRKGPAADLPATAFTPITCTDDRGQAPGGVRPGGGLSTPGSRQTRREGLPSPGSHRPT